MNQISSNRLDSDGNLSSKTIYLYNNLNLCDTSLNITMPTVQMTTYKYDSNNHKTEEKIFDINGRVRKTISFNYEYDEQKNWIYKIMYVNSVPTIIVEREIIYY